MEKMKIEVREVENQFELHFRRDGNNNPDPVYICLDCPECFLYASIGEQNSMPMHVWHGHTCRWEVPPLTAGAANEAMKEILPLARRIVAGYESEWDGHNHVAVYSDDALAAIEEVAEELGAAEGSLRQAFSDDEVISEVDPAEWYDPCGGPEVAGLDDAALEKYQAESESNLEPNMFIAGHWEYLVEQRDEQTKQTA